MSISAVLLACSSEPHLKQTTGASTSDVSAPRSDVSAPRSSRVETLPYFDEPGICLKMTKNMRVIQDAFMADPDVLLVSHSVTPDIDTPEVLQRYADAHGIRKDKWHLLTGERSQIYALGRKHYFVEEDLGVKKSENDFLHTENFLLMDKRGHIRGIYNGLKQTDIELLIADVRTLQAE